MMNFLYQLMMRKKLLMTSEFEDEFLDEDIIF